MSAAGGHEGPAETVAAAVGRRLAALGVETVFGVVGSGNLVATEALQRGGARFFAARHETGALCMADGWARVTGRVGVCSVHQGPGLTNAVTGLAEAAKARTPVLVIAGDTPGAALTSNFRIDQHDLANSVGAIAETVYSAASAEADAARAYRRAALERRPVVLNLPIDLQAQPAVDAPEPRGAARAGDARAARGGGRRRRRPAAGRAAAGHHRRPWRRPRRRRARARRPRRARRRAAGQQRDGAGDLPRRSVGAAHLGRVRLAGRRRAAAAGRRRPRVRRGAQPLDDAPRRAHRPAGARRAGRRRAARDRREPPDRPRRRRRHRRGGRGGGGRARRPRARRDRLPHRRGAARSSPPAAGATSPTSRRPRTATSTRATSRSRSPTCCRRARPSRSTPGTSWAGPRCSSTSRTRATGSS